MVKLLAYFNTHFIIGLHMPLHYFRYRRRRGAKYSIKSKEEGHNSNIGSVDKTPIMATQASSPGSGSAGNPVSIELEEKVDITGEEEQDYVNTSFLGE